MSSSSADLGGHNSAMGLGHAEIKTMLDSRLAALKEALSNDIFVPFGELRSEIHYIRTKLDAVAKDLSATREMTNNLALGSIAALNTKKPVNPIVAAQLESSDLFMRSKIISAITISSVAKYVSLSLGFSDSPSENVLETIRLSLFAPGTQARKKARRTDIGRKFVDLRIKIIRNMVFNCQVGVRRECMELLQPIIHMENQPRALLGRSASEKTSGAGSQSTPEQRGRKEGPYRAPTWTKKGFICRDDIDAAVGEILKQGVEESKEAEGIDAVADGGLVQTQTSKRRKTSGSLKLTIREKVSREIVKHMWKRWTDWFGNSRNEARKSFTLDLGVVFLEPHSRWKPMCSCNSAFQYNVEVFDGVEEMVHKQGGKELTMRRNLNMLKIAANFLTSYFQVSSLDDFLGGSESALKLVFIVTLGFYEIVCRASRPRTGSNNRELVFSEAKDLGLLIPGDTGRLDFLMEKCLRMTREKYDTINVNQENPSCSVVDFASGDEIGFEDEDVENLFL